MFQMFEVQEYENNAILNALPLDDSTRILRNARRVHLEVSRILHGAGEAPSSIYFPTSCVVSHSFTTQEGVSTSMALTGNDGMVGLQFLLGAKTLLHGAVIQISGCALKVPAALLQAEFARCSNLHHAILRYTQAFISQLAQTSACNRLHPLEQRLCRWLLLCHDYVHENQMQMTQESIANMVGGRRESVTLAAGRLQSLGVIRLSRGRIDVLDRFALEALACECYMLLREKQQPSRFAASSVPIPGRTKVLPGSNQKTFF